MRTHILFTTALLSLPPLLQSIYFSVYNKYQPIELETPLSTWGDEEYLSREYTVPLACATAPMLERIPTLSSKKAERILKERSALLQRLSQGGKPSYSSVHGIGEKGARYLERYISYANSTSALFGGCER